MKKLLITLLVLPLWGIAATVPAYVDSVTGDVVSPSAFDPADATHNHTATDVSDFNTEVSNNTDVTANTAKNSYPSADASKLAGIEAGAEVNTVDSVNTQTGAVVLDPDDLDDTSTVNKFTTAADISKLAGIEAGAQVNTVDSVNTQTGAVVLDADDISDSTTANKFTTSSDISKLAGIEAGAQVNTVTASNAVTFSTKTIDGDSNTLSNLDIGLEVDWASLTDVSDRTAFASGDKLLVFEAGVGLRKIDYDDLPGTGAGSGDMLKATYDPTNVNGDAFARANHTGTQVASTISDFDTEVSNNTDVTANTAKNSYPSADATKLAGIETGAQVNTVTPSNTIALSNKTLVGPVIQDANGDEILQLTTGTGTIVNHVEITNASSGNSVRVEAEGDDANIDLLLGGKGTGYVQVFNGQDFYIGADLYFQPNAVFRNVGGYAFFSFQSGAFHTDYMQVNTGNASNDPGFTAAGTNTNISLDFESKGTGVVKANGNRVLTVADEGTGNGLDADTLDAQEGSYYLARANHSGTQAASTISDFDTEVSNNVDVVANTAKNSYPSADATKLAGIEDNATADQTNAEILTAWETESGRDASVDGTKLDGIEAGAEVNTVTETNTVTLSNKTLSAPKITQGLYTQGGDQALRIYNTASAVNYLELWANVTGQDVILFAQGADANVDLQFVPKGSGTVQISGSRILTTADEGTGSGLDADTLDGEEGTHYLARANHTGTQTASTISDFDTEVSNNTDVTANTAKNSYPSADATKLAGIETGAEVNNISDVDATALTGGSGTGLHSHAYDRNRANHTGTQTASTISDFDTEVSNNTDVTANTAKVSNATHTGDVTGSTTLTIAGDTVSNTKLSNMAQDTIKGRATASTGDPEDLAASQVRTILGIEETILLDFAIGDEDTDITTGQKLQTDVPFGCVVTRVFVSVNTAPTGSAIQVDVEDEGTTILNAVISVAVSTNNAETSTFTGAASSYTFTKGDELTIDIDQIGSTVTGDGVKVYILGYYN